MALRLPISLAFLSGILWLRTLSGAEPGGSPSPAAVTEVHFDQPAPYASSVESMRHLGYTHPLPPYDLGQEKFRVIVPENYSTNSAWGLLVWVSPSDEPQIPASWHPELKRHQLLFVSACAAGNSRNAIDRCRLALDAVCNMSRRYKIDPRRILVAGFSGGGRIASILGVAYADVFTGALPICGADFYRDVQAPAGEVYPATYRPEPRILLRAKSNSRFVLLTGEQDINRDNTKVTAERGFQASGFKHVRYLEVAGMSHALPGAAVLDTALKALEPPSAAGDSR